MSHFEKTMADFEENIATTYARYKRRNTLSVLMIVLSCLCVTGLAGLLLSPLEYSWIKESGAAILFTMLLMMAGGTFEFFVTRDLMLSEKTCLDALNRASASS